MTDRFGGSKTFILLAQIVNQSNQVENLVNKVKRDKLNSHVSGSTTLKYWPEMFSLIQDNGCKRSDIKDN